MPTLMVSWAWAGKAARPKASAAAVMSERRVIGEVSIAMVLWLTHATSVRVAPVKDIAKSVPWACGTQRVDSPHGLVRAPAFAQHLCSSLRRAGRRPAQLLGRWSRG